MAKNGLGGGCDPSFAERCTKGLATMGTPDSPPLDRRKSEKEASILGRQKRKQRGGVQVIASEALRVPGPL